MAIDLSRIRKVFDPSKMTMPDDPYKYRTPPFFPEDPRTMPQAAQPQRDPFAPQPGGSRELYGMDAPTGPSGYNTPTGRMGDIGQIVNQQQAPAAQAPAPAPTTGQQIAPPAQVEPWSPPVTGQMPMGEPPPISQAIPSTKTHNPAQDEYMQAIKDMPQLNNPSVIRRIAASVVGGLTQSPDNSERILHQPYYEAMMPWSAKMPYLQQAANIERLGQAQESSDYNRYLQNEYRFQDLERRTREGQQRIESSNFYRQGTLANQAESNRIKAEALQGGRMYFNAMTGQGVLLKRNGQMEMIDRNILQGYSFEEELQLRNAGRLVYLNDQKGWDALIEEIRQAGAGARNQATIDARNSPDALTPPEVKVDEYNRARQYLNSNPNAINVIILGDPSTNDFQLIGPNDAGWTRNLERLPIVGGQREAARLRNEAEYEKAGKFVYGAAKWEQMKGQRTQPGQAPTGFIGPTRTQPQGQTTPAPAQGQQLPTAQPGQARAPRQTRGNLPPATDRVDGDEHTFTNGNVGRWDGRVWVPIKVVTR